MSTTQDPTTTVHPETTVSFNHREHDITCWLELSFPVEHEPEELLAALADVGFVHDGLRDAPPLDGVATTRVSKRGTDLFAGWTTAEKKENMRQARAVLRRYGFTAVPVNALTYFDLA